MDIDKKINAVQAMQEYIKAHLDESITLTDLSKVSFYSPWYSHRLFVEKLHMTPADYIRRFTPYEVKYLIPRKEKKMENVKNIFIQMIEKPERDVIIKRGITAKDYFAYCEEVGCDVWGILTSIKSISGEPVCLFLPKCMIPSGTSEYVQGVEVASGYSGPIPDGFEVIHLSAGKYLMFQGEPFAEENYCDAIEQVQMAIDKYDPSVNGFSKDLKSPRIQLEPIGTRGYIELLPIK